MKVKIIFLMLISIVCSAQSSGQYEISGAVLDKLNQEPLVGASILIRGTGSGTISSIDGYFELQIPEEDAEIAVSYVGYETRIITVLAGEKLKVELERSMIAFSDDIVIIGSRSVPRTVTSSAVPVDQFPAPVLQSSGETDLSQQLNALAPSFYSSRLTYSDATDHMDPATLRGMNPDQTLILINGKRHHPSAVVNVLSVVGRGSVINDLNTIPSSAVRRIEVLRDGASAQYGSDAIAGVINIVLKEDTGSVDMRTRSGQYYEGDGFQSYYAANLGKGFKNGGFINVTTELGVRDKTNRAGTYSGLIYRTADQDGLSYEENLTLDNQELSSRGLSREDFKLQLGNSEMSNANVFFNSSVPMKGNSEFYAFGGLNYRKSLSAGDYRLPNDPARSNLNIFPDGFLPEITAELNDQYITAGFRAGITDWKVDFSNSYGSNSIKFFVANSINASMGDDSPLEFESGGIRFSQNTTNLDFSYRMEDMVWLRALDVLIGSEFRVENYRIIAGEEASWINENQLSFPGAQGFPGYQPVDELDRSRTNTAVYADLGFDFSRSLFFEVAARYEQYSDFGNNLSAKAAIRYSPFDWIGMRGSVSTGFRAPALHQKYYSNTGTYYFGGSLFEVLTAPNNSRVADAFGIPELREETSTNVNVGLMFTPGKNTQLTVDLYQINVDDRVVLSSTFFRFDPAVDALLSDLPDVGGAQFFTNAIDTRTRGIDLVFTESVSLSNSRLGLSLGANLNETRVVGKVKTPEIIESNDLQSTLFDRQSRALLELSQPSTRYNISLSYITERLLITLRSIRYGEVSYRGVTEGEGRDQTYSAKWITNFKIDYQLFETLSINAGVNNLLDVYPEKNNEVLQDNGRFPYNTAVTQFGFNGGFYYAGLELNF